MHQDSWQDSDILTPQPDQDITRANTWSSWKWTTYAQCSAALCWEYYKGPLTLCLDDTLTLHWHKQGKQLSYSFLVLSRFIKNDRKWSKISACAMKIIGSFMIWFSERSLSWMVLFGLSLDDLDQFVSILFVLICFHLLNLTQFDSWNFQQSFLINGLYGLGQLIVFNSMYPRSKIYVEVYVVLCSFWFFKHVAGVWLLHRFNDGSDSAFLLLKIRSIRYLFGDIALAVSCLGCS